MRPRDKLLTLVEAADTVEAKKFVEKCQASVQIPHPRNGWPNGILATEGIPDTARVGHKRCRDNHDMCILTSFVRNIKQELAEPEVLLPAAQQSVVGPATELKTSPRFRPQPAQSPSSEAHSLKQPVPLTASSLVTCRRSSTGGVQMAVPPVVVPALQDTTATAIAAAPATSSLNAPAGGANLCGGLSSPRPSDPQPPCQDVLAHTSSPRIANAGPTAPPPPVPTCPQLAAELRPSDTGPNTEARSAAAAVFQETSPSAAPTSTAPRGTHCGSDPGACRCCPAAVHAGWGPLPLPLPMLPPRLSNETAAAIPVRCFRRTSGGAPPGLDAAVCEEASLPARTTTSPVLRAAAAAGGTEQLRQAAATAARVGWGADAANADADAKFQGEGQGHDCFPEDHLEASPARPACTEGRFSHPAWQHALVHGCADLPCALRAASFKAAQAQAWAQDVQASPRPTGVSEPTSPAPSGADTHPCAADVGEVRGGRVHAATGARHPVVDTAMPTPSDTCPRTLKLHPPPPPSRQPHQVPLPLHVPPPLPATSVDPYGSAATTAATAAVPPGPVRSHPYHLLHQPYPALHHHHPYASRHPAPAGPGYPHPYFHPARCVRGPQYPPPLLRGSSLPAGGWPHTGPPPPPPSSVPAAAAEAPPPYRLLPMFRYSVGGSGGPLPHPTQLPYLDSAAAAATAAGSSPVLAWSSEQPLYDAAGPVVRRRRAFSYTAYTSYFLNGAVEGPPPHPHPRPFVAAEAADGEPAGRGSIGADEEDCADSAQAKAAKRRSLGRACPVPTHVATAEATGPAAAAPRSSDAGPKIQPHAQDQLWAQPLGAAVDGYPTHPHLHLHPPHVLCYPTPHPHANLQQLRLRRPSSPSHISHAAVGANRPGYIRAVRYMGHPPPPPFPGGPWRSDDSATPFPPAPKPVSAAAAAAAAVVLSAPLRTASRPYGGVAAPGGSRGQGGPSRPASAGESYPPVVARMAVRM